MNAETDLRDFERGTKRTAKDFRRLLRKALEEPDRGLTKGFDEAFRSELSSILSHLAFAYEAVNAIGFTRSEKPSEKEQAFFLLHESLNLAMVAL